MQFRHRHLHKLLVQLSDHLQLLVLHHSSLLQDLQLLSEHTLQMGNIVEATLSRWIYCILCERTFFSGGQQCCQNSAIAPEPTLNFSSCSSDLWASISHCCKAVDTCWEYCCVIFCLETHRRCIKIMVFMSAHLFMTMHLPQNFWKILKDLISQVSDFYSQVPGLRKPNLWPW